MSELRQSHGQSSSEHLFSKIQQKKFALVARTLWPRKTAAELASRARVSERAAYLWLSGDRRPSVEAIRAIIDEL